MEREANAQYEACRARGIARDGSRRMASGTTKPYRPPDRRGDPAPPDGGDAGVIVCEEHYHAEMESRKLAALERGEPDYRGYPAWTEIEVYEPRRP